MNDKQQRAAERLRKALDACHEAGLSGGVYESQFRLWPSEEMPYEKGLRFFDEIERVGTTLHSDMILDGGAGW